MIYVEVFKDNEMWVASEPKTERFDSGTSVRSSIENLLLKYDLIDVRAVVTKIVDSNGSETVTYRNPNVSVIVTKDQLK